MRRYHTVVAVTWIEWRFSCDDLPGEWDFQAEQGPLLDPRQVKVRNMGWNARLVDESDRVSLLLQTRERGLRLEPRTQSGMNS